MRSKTQIHRKSNGKRNKCASDCQEIEDCKGYTISLLGIHRIKDTNKIKKWKVGTRYLLTVRFLKTNSGKKGEGMPVVRNPQFYFRERFLLPYRDGYKTVRVSDINHIETENKIVHLRLNNGTSEVVNVSMDELEHQLNPDYFFRANRQYIINVEHVLFLGNYFGGKLIVRLKGYPKTEIQVSKEKAQRLKEWIDR